MRADAIHLGARKPARSEKRMGEALWPPRAGKSRPRLRPIRYVTELADTGSERAIRQLIALMVLCCDPLAIALTAAASARRSTPSKATLVRSAFDCCRADATEGAQRLK
jgi:hypothetical protein